MPQANPTQFDIEAEKTLINYRQFDIERAEALNQLHNLYVQGQIDELKSLNKALFVESAIEARIATLEAQLTLKGDKDE